MEQTKKPFYGFPKIGKFEAVYDRVRKVHDFKGKDQNGDPIYENTEPYPTLVLTGKVKLDGTNAGVVFHPEGDMTIQSRNRQITVGDDNFGFAAFCTERGGVLGAMAVNALQGLASPNTKLAIFGEFCGKGMKGLDRTAVAELPKMFVVFGVQLDDKWVNIPGSIEEYNNRNIYSINQFPYYKMEVDFNAPAEEYMKKLEAITLNVEAECPVAKHFGIENGLGEGVVWYVDYNEERLFCKVKGEKHAVVNKKHKINPGDSLETKKAIASFVEYSVTENRLQQGIRYLEEFKHPLEKKSIQPFFRWVVEDIIKEEEVEILANSIPVEPLKKALGMKAKVWYLKYLRAQR